MRMRRSRRALALRPAQAVEESEEVPSPLLSPVAEGTRRSTRLTSARKSAHSVAPRPTPARRARRSTRVVWRGRSTAGVPDPAGDQENTVPDESGTPGSLVTCRPRRTPTARMRQMPAEMPPPDAPPRSTPQRMPRRAAPPPRSPRCWAVRRSPPRVSSPWGTRFSASRATRAVPWIRWCRAFRCTAASVAARRSGIRCTRHLACVG